MIHVNNVYCMEHIIMLYYVYVLVAGHNQLVSSAITSSKIIVIVLVYWFPLFREREKCHVYVFWGGKPLIMIIITATDYRVTDLGGSKLEIAFERSISSHTQAFCMSFEF